MRRWYQRYGRTSGIALALLLVAAWYAPTFLSAERYRGRLEAALRHTLERPVGFGAVSFRLLPRPGFSIENAVVREDPAFGSEPFARVDRIDCDLRWRSLWRSRLEFVRLHLDRPSFNLVRNSQGEWNIESLLLKSGVASPHPYGVTRAGDAPGELQLEAEDGRINFKVGDVKKPFAITDLRARLSFDLVRGLLRFRVLGSPIRADLLLPTPGELEVVGRWTPGKDLAESLEATLRTQGALLYDWIPLVTGHNPGIYGVVDAEILLTGSSRTLRVEGRAQVRDLHRWEQLPPSDSLPFTLYFRGQFDRPGGRLLLESLDASFADSRVHVTGLVNGIPASPALDLVLALERSRLEDLLALRGRLWGNRASLGISGRVDGLLTIQGPWTARRYGGFISARDAQLSTASGTFPLSEVALRIVPEGARLAPVRLTLAPRVELLAEGALYRFEPKGAGPRAGGPPRYELVFSAKAIPLRDLARFGRAVGVRALQGIDAQGLGTASFRLAGLAWPLSRPALEGRAELRAARLFLPGLTEPLNLPRARIQVTGDHVIAEPVVAVLGTSVFTGRLEHRGDRSRPWKFDVWANSLSLEQGALWFDALGNRSPLPLLERLPALSSSTARRVAASSLFGAVNARGQFAAPSVTYHGLTLGDFRASVEISGRMVRIGAATFVVGGGRGQGRAEVDLTSAPARVTADLRLAGARLEAAASRLPAALRRARGTVSGSARLETRGLTRKEMSDALRGEATLQLKNISLGDFDPLQLMARHAGWGTLEPARGEADLGSAVLTLLVRDRRISLRTRPLELAGAKLLLAGTCRFDGTLDLGVEADFQHLKRRWLAHEAGSDSDVRRAHLHLAGHLDKVVVTPGMQLSRITP